MNIKEARKTCRIKLAELHTTQRGLREELHKPHTPVCSQYMSTAQYNSHLITGWSNKLNELCGRKPCHGTNPDILRWWSHQDAKELRELVIETPVTA